MRGFEDIAGEAARFTGEDLATVVVPAGLSTDVNSFCGVFTDSPGAFAETPVVIVFVRAAVEHFFAAGLGTAWETVGADDAGAHAAAGENANGEGVAAVG